MRTPRSSTLARALLLLAGALLLLAPSAGAAPPDRADGLDHYERDVFEIVGSTLRNPTAATDAAAGLYNVAGVRLEAPDGTPLTWGSWSAASARSTVRTVGSGSRPGSGSPGSSPGACTPSSGERCSPTPSSRCAPAWSGPCRSTPSRGLAPDRRPRTHSWRARTAPRATPAARTSGSSTPARPSSRWCSTARTHRVPVPQPRRAAHPPGRAVPEQLRRRRHAAAAHPAEVVSRPVHPRPVLALDLRAQPLLLLARLGGGGLAEVLGLDDLADLDLGAAVEGGPLDPLDALVERLGLQEPEARHELLGLGERPVDHGAAGAVEAHPGAAAAGVKTLAGQHDRRP